MYCYSLHSAQLEAGRSSTSSSSYARYTPAPACPYEPPPPPDYKAGLVPGGPTPTFFPTPEEDTYASVDTRPLPTIPAKTVEESDYEDGYILQVDSIPARNELPGIMIGEERCHSDIRYVLGCTVYTFVRALNNKLFPSKFIHP